MMEHETHQIAARVYEAKKDSRAADKLIEDYLPFIRSETAKFLNRPPTDSDDELSIAMFAFFESIQSYSRLKGPFLRFAAVQIRRRLIDNYRRERRNQGHISLDAPLSGDTEDLTVGDTLQDRETPYEDMEIREATRQEIAHLSAQMEEFGVSLSDVAENAPQQRRTLAACQKAVCYARNHPAMLEDFLRTRKIPLTKLAEEAGVEKKTLERHRRYLVAVLLICTNGYEIMRGHMMQVLKGGETE
jgi:RNA polymerase sigma factor